jgi:hypothetical protein
MDGIAAKKLITAKAKLKPSGTNNDRLFLLFMPKPPQAPADSIPLAKPERRVRSLGVLASAEMILREAFYQ